MTFYGPQGWSIQATDLSRSKTEADFWFEVCDEVWTKNRKNFWFKVSDLMFLET